MEYEATSVAAWCRRERQKGDRLLTISPRRGPDDEICRPRMAR